MKKANKEIPLKNYIILALMTIIVVVLTLYINAWIKTYKENKISESPFSGVVEEVNINDLSLSLAETNEVVLYVGYTNDKKIYDMEKRLIKYIKKHDIVDKFMYLDVTGNLESKDYIDSLKKTFKEVSDDIKEAPMLIYIKNGVATKVVNATDGVIHTYDISSLNKTYELE